MALNEKKLDDLVGVLKYSNVPKRKMIKRTSELNSKIDVSKQEESFLAKESPIVSLLENFDFYLTEMSAANE